MLNIASQWPLICNNIGLDFMHWQTTIGQEVETHGVGLHTAVKSRLRLVPAPADTGIVFRRVDLDNFEIEAQVRNVARVSYATSLMKKGVLLSTTEHLLAALYSCGVDNVYVEIDALELPILDGSSQPFIEMLEQAGIRRLRKRRRYLKVVKPLEVSEGGRRIGIYPAEISACIALWSMRIRLSGSRKSNCAWGANHSARCWRRRARLASCRILKGCARMGLIRGGSLENAIVLDEIGVMNGPLRFPDEFGRHKALDLIGDLALVGRPLLARVEAHKAGHALHTQLVTRLLADPSLWTETTDSAPSAARIRADRRKFRSGGCAFRRGS